MVQNISRILTPKGEILKVLLEGSRSAPQIVRLTNAGRTAVYTSLKVLLIAGLITKNKDLYRISNAGIKAYISEVLPDIDADSLLSVSEEAGIFPLELIKLSVRMILTLAEIGHIPADLARLLARHNLTLLNSMKKLFKEKPDKGEQAEAGVLA